MAEKPLSGFLDQRIKNIVSVALCKKLDMKQTIYFTWPYGNLPLSLTCITFDCPVTVGGGTAGSVVAARLSEDQDTTVLLIEAGGDVSSRQEVDLPMLADQVRGSDADWSYRTVPQRHACKGHVDGVSLYCLCNKCQTKQTNYDIKLICRQIYGVGWGYWLSYMYGIYTHFTHMYMQYIQYTCYLKV